ncbi:MAG: PilZ domain-containing protein [Gammaproteobacteria bacterium]
MEHRMDVRFPLHVPALLITNDQRLEGETLDLSFEGAGMRPAPAQNFSTVQPRQPVRLQLGPGPDALELPAMIIRRDEHGIGLLFSRYTPEAEDRLAGLLTGYLDIHGQRLFA